MIIELNRENNLLKKYMKETKTNSGFSTGFVLFIVFLILKLTHVIDWSWWWITCPIWISVVLFFTFFFLFLMLPKKK